MAANKKLLMLPGDGIGPEVMGQARRVIDWMDKIRHVSFDVAENLVGGVSYDKHGTPLSDETLADSMGVGQCFSKRFTKKPWCTNCVPGNSLSKNKSLFRFSIRRRR